MSLSEATLRWESWRGKRRRVRRLASWGGSVGLAALVLALMAWGGFPPLFEVGEKGEALSVKLGNPDGEDLPLSVSSVPDQAMQAVMSAQREISKSTVSEIRPDTEEVPAAMSTPAKPVPQTKPQEAAKPAPANPPSEKPAENKNVIRGQEKGNSSELVLKPQGDKISQNAYWPVYLFMPLPKKLDVGLLARVKDTDLFSALERRDLLLQYYAKADMTLSRDVPLEVRPALWVILESVGYDIVNADYKRSNPQPVVITFRIDTPKGAGDNPDLLDVKLEQSSGTAAIDEAVLYAFKKSTFANGTGQVAQGRYTYDFTGKK